MISQLLSLTYVMYTKQDEAVKFTKCMLILLEGQTSYILVIIWAVASSLHLDKCSKEGKTITQALNQNFQSY